jgi:hypothetical protein
MLVQPGPTDTGLNLHKRRYHHQSSELTTDLSQTFPSDILHFTLVAPPDIIKPTTTIQILKPSIHKPGNKKR